MTPPPLPVDEAPPTMEHGRKLVAVSCFGCDYPPPLIEVSWVFPLIGIAIALAWLALRRGARRLRRVR